MNMIEIDIFLGIAVMIPGWLTLWNLYNLFSKKPKNPIWAFFLTTGIGLGEYILYMAFFKETAGDWNESILVMQFHNTLDSAHLLSFLLPCVVAVLGMLVIALIPAKNLPPLVAATSVATVLIGNVMNILYAIQIGKNMTDLPLDLLPFVYHFNLLILSIQSIRKQIVEQVALMEERKTTLRHKWLAPLYQFASTVPNMTIFTFIMVIPIAIVMELLLILFGQGPDGIVQAFTMTADWTFSKQIPPPPIDYDGHYLCTVAAGGHQKIVKPLRFGKRLGQPIIVNRQLCIANAFEELIAEKTPSFHKKLRHFYNTHGYPLSRLITSPAKADAVYILMKPLEWFFLLILYLFDPNPESRIARQYQ